MLRCSYEAKGTELWGKAILSPVGGKRQALSLQQQPKLKVQSDFETDSRGQDEIIQRENAKGSFWSNTTPQATVIRKHASLLLIFHLYYLPVRICWLIKLFFS